jgi:hypothetical protein
MSFKKVGDCFPDIGTTPPDQLVTGVLKFLEQSFSMAFQAGWGEARRTDSQEMRSLQVCRTLIWGERAENGEPAQQLYMLYHAAKAFQERGDFRDFSAAMSKLQRIDQLFTYWAGDRRFGVTRNGHLGSFPAVAKPGDKTCVFYGGRVLYVIRPCGDSSYTYVGDCYMDGFMDGEAVQSDDLPTEEFALR